MICLQQKNVIVARRLRIVGAMCAVLVFGALVSSATAEHIWPMFQYDRGNTGRCPYPGITTDSPETQWSYDTGGQVLSSPAIAEDGTIYIGSDANHLYAFNPDGSVFTDPVICSPATHQRLQEGLLLLYTGLTRRSEDILAEQARETQTNANKQASLRCMVGLAGQLHEALCQDNVEAFGEILHTGWMEKRKLTSDISNGHIDAWYERARAGRRDGGGTVE